MPTSTQLIDNAIKFVDNVDPSRGEQATRRLKYEEWLREVVDEYFHEIDDKSSYRDSDVVPDSDGRASLPSTFLTVGRQGGLYYSRINGGTGQKFEERDYQVLKESYHSSAGATREYIYAIGFGVDGAATRYLWVPRGWSGITLVLNYRKASPVPTDGGSQMNEIPETYHYRIFKPYLRFRGFEDKGDPRAATWERRYLDGLNSARKTEKAKDSTQIIAGSGYGSMY